MLFGSVPSPPGIPRSCTSTQTTRQNAIEAATARRSTAGRSRSTVTPASSAAPLAASAITATRFTAKP